MEFIFIALLALIVFYVINKNKKANPELLNGKPAVFEEFRVSGSADLVYKSILQFGQNSDYKIDHVNNGDRQLILNYVPKMGEQTNGSFFPIWVSAIDEETCSVRVGAKDKSAISMNFEVKKALAKLLPKLQAAIYSAEARSEASVNQSKNSWNKERDLSSDEYQIYLIKKYQVEKNEVLGRFIADGKSYANVDDALSAAHEKDLEGEKLAQEKFNNDLSEPHPDTHVKCPECRGLVRKEANKCRHCGCRLTPQRF
jgi:hypothetical protein